MNERYAKRFEFGNTPARATISVSALPEGHIVYTGVAVRDLSKRKAIRPKNMAPSPTASPCVFAGDTLYCSAKSGFIPGPLSGVYAATVEHQLRQTMRNQLDNFEEAGLHVRECGRRQRVSGQRRRLREDERDLHQYFPATCQARADRPCSRSRPAHAIPTPRAAIRRSNRCRSSPCALKSIVHADSEFPQASVTTSA